MLAATVRLLPFTSLENWASDSDARAEFDFLVGALNVRTDDQREFFGTILDALDVMEVTLRRWELGGEMTFGMPRLFWAWKCRPTVYAAIPRRVLEHSPNEYEFAEELRRNELFLDRDALFLLLQCQFPSGSDEQAQRDLRAWT